MLTTMPIMSSQLRERLAHHCNLKRISCNFDRMQIEDNLRFLGYDHFIQLGALARLFFFYLFFLQRGSGIEYWVGLLFLVLHYLYFSFYIKI